jgi:hypothetical protein
VKTSIILLASGTLLASLYACGDDEEGTTAPAATSSSTSQQASSTSSTGGNGSGGNGSGGDAQGGQGGTGGGACLSCAEYLAECGPGGQPMMECLESQMCAPSAALWTALNDCFCKGDVCATNCAGQCGGSGGMQCQMCFNQATQAGGECETSYNACTADM